MKLGDTTKSGLWATSSLRKTWVILGGAGGLLLALACGSKAPEVPPSAPRERDSYEEPKPMLSEMEGAQGASSDPAQGEPTSSHESSGTPPVKERSHAEELAERCEAVCRVMDTQCKDRAQRLCRGKCDEYTPLMKSCPFELAELLTCQEKAEDKIACSNMIAESCVLSYKELTACEKGERAAWTGPRTGETAKTEGYEAPGGFHFQELPDWSVASFVPAGASELQERQKKRYSGKDGDIEYAIEPLPSTPKTITDKTILKTVLDYLGFDCQKSLKVYGRFETKEVVHVRFETECKAGTAYRGMVHLWDGKGYVSYARRAEKFLGEDPKLEPFLFSFKKLP